MISIIRLIKFILQYLVCLSRIILVVITDWSLCVNSPECGNIQGYYYTKVGLTKIKFLRTEMKMVWYLLPKIWSKTLKTAISRAILWKLWQFVVQGHSRQTVFFETALTDRNMKVKFVLKLVVECWDMEILVYGTKISNILTQRPLLDQMLDRPSTH